MDEAEMNTVSLLKLKDHPVTVPLIWLGIIFMSGWLGKPMAKAALAAEFYTQDQARAHVNQVTSRLDTIENTQGRMSKTMDADISERKAAGAFQLLRALSADLAAHRQLPKTAPGWSERDRLLVEQVDLAHEYKDCVMNERPKCDIIQRQIFR